MNNPNIGDIFLAFVPYENKSVGKDRPVVFAGWSGQNMVFFAGYGQYESRLSLALTADDDNLFTKDPTYLDYLRHFYYDLSDLKPWMTTRKQAKLTKRNLSAFKRDIGVA